jgi:ABC-type iron transport system FetAB ATPase subunit
VNDKEIEKNHYNNSAIGALENNSILNIDELMHRIFQTTSAHLLFIAHSHTH